MNVWEYNGHLTFLFPLPSGVPALLTCMVGFEREWKGVIFGLQGEGNIPLFMCPSRSHAPKSPLPFPFNACHAAGLSLRLGGRGFPLATYPMSMTPAIFIRNKRRMRPKELPGCSVPQLLTALYPATWNLSDSRDVGYCLAGLSAALVWLNYSSSVIVLSDLMIADDIFYYLPTMEVKRTRDSWIKPPK